MFKYTHGRSVKMNTSISQIINQKILPNFLVYLLRHYNVGAEKEL